MTIEETFETLRDAEGNEKKTFDLYEINEDHPIDPLSKIVPLDGITSFFGTYACNILVFTKLYFNGDEEFDTEYITSKARLIETFDKFAKYETHVWIDSSASDIQDASTNDLNTFDDLLTEMCNELAEYGFTYHGQLGEGDLANSISDVIIEFSNGL